MTEMANDRAARMVERMDVDGDGLISVEEMAARPGPEMIFERIDVDGDGSVTKAEVEAAQARMAEGRGGRHGDHRGPGEGRGHGEGRGGPDGGWMRGWWGGDN
jgi:hypothetical protein